MQKKKKGDAECAQKTTNNSNVYTPVWLVMMDCAFLSAPNCTMQNYVNKKPHLHI
jgi:hypothetical protein